MEDAFIKRDLFTREALLNRESFKSLISRLDQLGFKKKSIILPAYIFSENTNKSGPAKNITVDKFLEYDEDFDAVILRAENENNKEEVVFLFKNDSSNKVTFNDTIFAFIDKSPKSNIYISTMDPVRTFGLITYFKDFFENQVPNPILKNFLIAITVVFASTLAYFVMNNVVNLRSPFSLLIIGSIIVWGVILIRYLPRTGLHTSSAKPKISYPIYVDKLKENWLVIVIAALLGFLFSLLGNYLASYLGWK